MADSLFQMMRTAGGWKLKFSGIVDVTQEEQQAILDSGLAVLMVAARAGKAEVDFKENGEVVLAVTVKISDSALMVGPLRESAITYLAHGPDQGQLVFPNYNYDGAQELPEGPSPHPSGADEEALEEGGFDLPEDLAAAFTVDDDDPGVTEVVGNLRDYRGVGQQGTPNGGDRPKVGKFDPDMVPGTPSGGGGTETMGSIYPPGHKGTDKVLADFMNEEHPHSG